MPFENFFCAKTNAVVFISFEIKTVGNFAKKAIKVPL